MSFIMNIQKRMIAFTVVGDADQEPPECWWHRYLRHVVVRTAQSPAGSSR